MYGIDWEDCEVEAKFKVGDRVRVVRDGWGDRGSYHGAKVGDVDEIIAVDLSDDLHPYEGRAWYYQENEIELAPPEPKFKIGDVVRVIDDRGGGKIGDIGQVTDVQDDGSGVYYHLLGITDAEGLYEERLELAPDCAEHKVEQDNAPATDTKPQPKFKAGDVVKHMNGDEHYIISDVREDGQLYFAKYPSAGYCTPDYFSLVLAQPSTPCIIASVNNGKPLPSRYPHVHASVADATAEAERLARNNPGTEFAVYQRVAGRVAEVSYKMKEVA